MSIGALTCTTYFPTNTPFQSRKHVNVKIPAIGSTEDIDEAILLYRQSVELQPGYHSDRSLSLNNLGVALSLRFTKSNRMEDLDEALLCHRDVLKLQPWPHPN